VWLDCSTKVLFPMFRQITRRGDLSGLPTRPSCFIPMPLNRYFTSNPDSNSPMTGIRANHNFDQQKLFQYLSANGIDGFNNSTLCTVKQFSHGQSNPTFMIIGDNGKKFTVRKQPPGLPCPHYPPSNLSRKSLAWSSCCGSRICCHDSST
jgi:hypothetical protein